ncbi:MAG: TonB-dependent receptor [Prevotellaceae bacterium]|nr:TonB-dependent receptor [Prevotellaceae bacterium]
MKNFILFFLCSYACVTAVYGQRVITGKVTGPGGEPLSSVTVIVSGTNTGTSTLDDGSYSVSVPDGAKTLEFSLLGFETFIASIGTGNVINTVLEESVTELEDVVVTSYGTQKKISVTGSIQTVKPADLLVPSSRLSTSFAGRLAGVIAFQRSGQPGNDGASFYIRGISTFGGITSPLIIVDGVEVSSGDLNNLDPEVIESFSILKDATATAMYGSRGANGVMIVVTKSGRDLKKPVINIRLENTFNTPTKIPQVADGVTYMTMYNEAVSGRGTGEILYSGEKIERTSAGYDPLLYPDVNWYGEMFKNVATSQKTVFNIRGGGQRLDYFMNVSVGHEEGMLKAKSRDFFSYNNNIGIWRYNFQNNINLNLSRTTKVGLRLNTQLYDYSGPYLSTGDIFGMIMESNPVDFPILFPNGTAREESSLTRGYIAWGGKTGGRYNSGYRNPVAEMVRGYNSNFQSTVIANLDFSQKLDFVTDGLTFDALVSFKNWTSSTTNRYANYNQFYVTKYELDNAGMMDSYQLAMVGSEQSDVLTTDGSTSGDRRIYIQTALNYNRVFNKIHNVSAMILYNQNQYNVNNPSDLYSSLPKRKQGIAGRVTYSYDYRYLFEANFGYNGSENFAENYRFGFFPSFSAGYNISQEKFWKPLSRIISNLKLRGSWGLVGNDQTNAGRFIYLSDINLTGVSYTTGINMDYSLSGPSYGRYANNNLTWEVGNKINAGIDLQLLSSLNITFDIYKEHRTGIFLERQTIPSFLGTADTKVYGNLGIVDNRGFDFSIDFSKRVNENLSVSFKGTFTLARNEIRDYDEPEYKLYRNKTRVGHAVNSIEMYQAERLFIDDLEVANSPRQQLGGFIQAGDIKYTDIPNINGVSDGIIDANDMMRTGYPTVPEIVYGFGPSIQWKKIDFSFLFQGAARTSLMMSGFHPFGSSSIRNSLQFVADNYWSRTNQDIYAAYPRLSKQDNANNTASSTYWLRDASFLKLKNLEIGFTYKFLRIYLSGANLLTFSTFKLWDPEMGGGAGMSYPTQRAYNIGLQMNL